MFALQNASAVTTNASELAKKAKAFIDREIFLIPNGIDTECFKPMGSNLALAEALGLGGGKKKEDDEDDEETGPGVDDGEPVEASHEATLETHTDGAGMTGSHGTADVEAGEAAAT